MNKGLAKVILYGLGAASVLYTMFQEKIESVFYEIPDIRIEAPSIEDKVEQEISTYPVINDKLMGDSLYVAKEDDVSVYSKAAQQYRGPGSNR